MLFQSQQDTNKDQICSQLSTTGQHHETDSDERAKIYQQIKVFNTQQA